MASVTVTPTVPVVRTYNLELTEAEAQRLYDFIGCIGGVHYNAIRESDNRYKTSRLPADQAEGRVPLNAIWEALNSASGLTRYDGKVNK